MMKRMWVVAAALLLTGSLALAGEGMGLKVEGGLDIGVVQNVELFDGDVDGSSMALVPSVAVTKQFTDEWSASLRLRGLFGFEDDSADFDGDDGTLSISGFDIGGLAGYTLKVNDQFTVTPVAGLSYRMWSVDLDDDDADVSGTEDCGLLVLDFGAKAAYKLNDKFSITGGLMLGLGLLGSSSLDGDFDDDGDLDGVAFLFEIKGGVEYKLNDTVSLTGGLAYETLSATWDWDDADDTADDELSRFSIQLGAAYKF